MSISVAKEIIKKARNKRKRISGNQTGITMSYTHTSVRHKNNLMSPCEVKWSKFFIFP
jgi:hypothetical protein